MFRISLLLSPLLAFTSISSAYAQTTSNYFVESGCGVDGYSANTELAFPLGQCIYDAGSRGGIIYYEDTTIITNYGGSDFNVMSVTRVAFDDPGCVFYDDTAYSSSTQLWPTSCTPGAIAAGYKFFGSYKSTLPTGGSQNMAFVEQFTDATCSQSQGYIYTPVGACFFGTLKVSCSGTSGSAIQYGSNSACTGFGFTFNIPDITTCFYAGSYYAIGKCLPAVPTVSPPSYRPTARPTFNPSARPSFRPSVKPSVKPTTKPSSGPTYRPTARPSYRPTARPSYRPTARPSYRPTARPSYRPTARPSYRPTARPSYRPTIRPTSGRPTTKPSTRIPSGRPSMKPTVKST